MSICVIFEIVWFLLFTTFTFLYCRETISLPPHSFSPIIRAVLLFLHCRKSSILEEVGSVCNGMVGMVVYFSLTWAFAPLAYIRFPDVALPDFYPCFQVVLTLFVFPTCQTTTRC